MEMCPCTTMESRWSWQDLVGKEDAFCLRGAVGKVQVCLFGMRQSNARLFLGPV